MVSEMVLETGRDGLRVVPRETIYTYTQRQTKVLANTDNYKRSGLPGRHVCVASYIINRQGNGQGQTRAHTNYMTQWYMLNKAV